MWHPRQVGSSTKQRNKLEVPTRDVRASRSKASSTVLRAAKRTRTAQRMAAKKKNKRRGSLGTGTSAGQERQAARVFAGYFRHAERSPLQLLFSKHRYAHQATPGCTNFGCTSFQLAVPILAVQLCLRVF